MESIPPVFSQRRLFYLVAFIVVELTFFDRFTTAGLLGPDVKKLKRRWDVAGLALLLEHKEPQIQYEAAEALGNLGDEKAVGPLIATLQYPDDDVRWKAAIALGEIGNPDAIAPLISLLSDEDRYVRSRAAHALSMIGEPAVPPPLIHALKRADPGVRWGAALALGKIKKTLAVEPLILALADEQVMVRAEAAAIGTPALGPLLGFLKGARGETRIEVMTALGELKNADAIEPLVQLLENADDGERQAIADAIDAILIPAVEPLVRRIRNGNSKKECNGKKLR
ncbi:MAG: HEAT repeat domain-containing protein [Methanoregula sp.]|jgi:HEAT repeat protein